MKKKEIYKKRLAALKQDIKKKYTNKKFIEERSGDQFTTVIDVLLPEDFNIFNPLSPAKYGMNKYILFLQNMI